MNRAIYAAASGGVAALARLDAVAQNLANVSTAGYKAERVVFRVRSLGTSGPDNLDPVLRETAAQAGEPLTIRDFSQGPIRPSGNPLDVALAGEGFFAVATPRGERYTRQGTFTRDAEGFLVTQHGERVEGDNGDIQIGAGDVTIAEDGTVTSDGAAVGRLKVVRFANQATLAPEGTALFSAPPGNVATPLDASAVQLHPQAIEGANIDPVAGMVELVDVSRGFEAYMQATRRLDEVANHAITDVGRV